MRQGPCYVLQCHFGSTDYLCICTNNPSPHVRRAMSTLGPTEIKVSMVRTDPFPFLERLLGEWWIGEDSAAGLARRSPLID